MIYNSRDEGAGKRPVPADMNPAVKLFCLLLLAASYLSVSSPFGHLFAAAFLLALLYLSELPFRAVTSVIKRLFPLLGFVTLLNFCFFSPENAFFRWWIISPSVSGAVRGVCISLKIVEIVALFDVFNALTSPAELIFPLAVLFRPLSLLGIESEQIAITLSASFSFPDVLKDEFEKISRLQSQSGSGFPAGKKHISPREKSKLLLPVLYEALNRTRERAALLEARGVPEALKTYAEFPKKLSIVDVGALTVCTAFFALQLIIFR